MLTSINEREEKDAQKAFYNKIETDMSNKRMKRLKFWKRVSRIHAPGFVLAFMTVYWISGLKHAGIF